MEIQHSMTDGCLVVTFAGSIDLFSASHIQRALLKDLSQQPYGLICDLSGVQQLDPVCATVFATVANHPSSRWPTTSFLLGGAQPSVAEILGRLRVPHFLPLYQDLEEALAEVFARPPYLRDELVLAPIPAAPAVARAFVRDTCRYWQLALPDATVADRAVLLAGELVTNAVVHARTELRLRLELRGELLHLAVRDGSPRLLRLVTDPDPEAEGGRGLWLVEQLARAWGCNPSPTAARSSGAPSSCKDCVQLQVVMAAVSGSRSWARARHGRPPGRAGDSSRAAQAGRGRPGAGRPPSGVAAAG